MAAQRARSAVAVAAQVLTGSGLDLAAVAARLGGPAARTIRSWRDRHRRGRLRALPRGRPPKALTKEHREQARRALQKTGGRLGRDALVAKVPGAPVRALRHLLGCYRAAVRRRGFVLCGVLGWLRPGRVQGLDLSDVPPAALGRLRKLLYVRDLSARSVLGPEPLVTKSAAEVVPALAEIFRRFGAPLVLKLDNEKTFHSGSMRALCRSHGVVLLFSPPGLPSYNGSAEATIGAHKRRTEQVARMAGRPGAWLLEDVLEAAREANETSRPWGAHGPTPNERFEERTEITPQERQRFRDAVSGALRRRRRDDSLSAEHVSGRRDRTAAHKRSAIVTALTDLGYLEIRRRRITPPFKTLRTARIT